MPNTLITPTQVTREALRVLHQKLNFIGSITRDYDSQYAKKEAKIGDTLKIRLPNQYVVRSGATLNITPPLGDTVEQTVDLRVNQQRGVDLAFTSVDLTLSLDDFSERIIEPAMNVLAANIEADAMSMYRSVSQSIWNGGSPSSFPQVLAGRKVLVDALAPLGNRTANLNTTDNVDLVDALKGLFNDTTNLSKQYREGYMGRTAGFDFMENTLWPSHTNGARVANTYRTNTQVGTLALDGTAYSTITLATGTGAANVGDVFTIENCFRVHPETRVSTGVLQQFVVTAAFAGGAGPISISPAIVLGGARQNCVIPTTSATAVVTFLGTASATAGTSLLYHKDAFAFATADMVMPDGVDWKSRQVLDGISMRIIRQYDINNDRFPCRLDVLYGYAPIRPSLAVRLHNR
jgi:hypothetical protein